MTASSPIVGIIGFGSIARKHLAEVKAHRPDASVIIRTRQEIAPGDWPDDVKFTPSIEELLARQPDVIMVATPASEHADGIETLAESGARLVVEKPVAAKSEDALRMANTATATGQAISVAYNLRYLEGLPVLEGLLSSGALGAVQEFSMIAGQDLAEWRPGRDYTTSVSAQAAKGGGVLRELSHELDLACHLFGAAEDSTLKRAKMKYKTLDVEDTAIIKASFRDSQINGTIALDFTRERPERRITITGEDAALEWDLIRGDIHLDHGHTKKCIFAKDDDIKTTYRRMWGDLLDDQPLRLPTAKAASRLIQWIEDMEHHAELVTGS